MAGPLIVNLWREADGWHLEPDVATFEAIARELGPIVDDGHAAFPTPGEARRAWKGLVHAFNSARLVTLDAPPERRL